MVRIEENIPTSKVQKTFSTKSQKKISPNYKCTIRLYNINYIGPEKKNFPQHNNQKTNSTEKKERELKAEKV